MRNILYKAPSISVTVVSVATPLGLIRVIKRFATPREVIIEADKATKILGMQREWTAYVYDGLPTYMPGVESLWVGDSGVYIYNWIKDTENYWNDPKKRISSGKPNLLWVPHGWLNHSAKARMR